MEMKVIHPGGW